MTSSDDFSSGTGWRLRAIAERLGDDPLGKRLAGEAEAINADVRATQGRALLNIARRRSARVVTGLSTLTIIVAFVAGVLLLGIGTDYLASERADRIAAAKACAEAQKALHEQKLSPTELLPKLCRPTQDAPVAGKTKPDEYSETATTLSTLASQYQKCIADAIKAGDPEAKVCIPTLGRIRDVAGGDKSIR